ncbi:DUF1801 domain-containing protein [Saccharomonospora sp. NPDC046836]|uniref:iron chaperone n=1 Tax=Saccharomonospora sp. NPDC046836 TaxID=3156921 RepID=UPI0033F36AFD
MTAPGSIDEYVAAHPPETREVLSKVAAAMRRALPGAEERIRYGMPAFMLGGRYSLHFAGWKTHVGLYPVPRLDDELETLLEPYRTKKDTVRFMYRQPVPYDLIERVAAAVRPG